MKALSLLVLLVTCFMWTGCSAGGSVADGARGDRVERGDAKVCRGDFFVDGCPDWQPGCTTTKIETVAACTEIVGILSFWGSSTTQVVELENLRSVKGWMGISQNMSLKAVHMPKLESVVGEFHVLDNSVLETVDFFSLTNMEGQFYIERNSALDKLVLPRLGDVSERLRVEDNVALKSIDLPRLVRLDVGTISGNRALTSLKISSLEEVKTRLEITRNVRLADIDLGSLDKAGLVVISEASGKDVRLGSLREVEEIHFLSNTGMTDLSMPSLEFAGTLLIDANRRLKTLELPALGRAGTVRVRGNMDLRALHLSSLREVNQWFVVSGNRGLTSLEAPGLVAVGNAVDLIENARLATVDLGGLNRVGFNATAEGIEEVRLATGAPRAFSGNFLRVEENKAFGTCEANALRDQLRGFTGTVKIADNKADGCYRPDVSSDEEDDE